MRIKLKRNTFLMDFKCIHFYFYSIIDVIIIFIFLEQGSSGTGSCTYVAHEQLSYAFSVWRMEGEWNNVNQE